MPSKDFEDDFSLDYQHQVNSKRDLVRFYYRISETLKKYLTTEKFGEKLNELRTGKFIIKDIDQPETEVIRFLQRLGEISSDGNVFEQYNVFLSEISQATSRPKENIYLHFYLLSFGEDNSSVMPVCGSTPNCKVCLLTKECDYYNRPRSLELSLLSPVKRLLSTNEEAISNAELLGLLFFGEKAVGDELPVKSLLGRYGRLRALFNAELHEYSGMRDMTPALVIRLAAVSALYRRLLKEKRDSVLQITSPKDLYDRYFAELRDYKNEAAVLVLLNQKNQLIRDIWFTEGSINVVRISISDLIRPALLNMSVRVAMVHNHPSGDSTPSYHDYDFTDRFRIACSMFDIELVDHVIVTDNSYFSIVSKHKYEL